MFKIKVYSFGQAIITLIATLALLFAITIFYFWLWKIIMVAIFDLPMLTFWQFIGLTCLTRWFTGIGTNLRELVDFRNMESENDWDSNNS